MSRYGPDQWRASGGDMRPALAVDQRCHDALTDLYAYALALDAERHDVKERIETLDLIGSEITDPDVDRDELVVLRRRTAEITAQLGVVWATIAALRAHADPDGLYL